MGNNYTLGQLVILSQGFAVNIKSKHIMSDSGLPLLRITDLINNQEVQFLDPVLAPEKCKAKATDIIYTRTGQVGLVFRNRVGAIHNNCFKVIPNEELIDADFLYWFLSQENIKKLANGIAAGSVQKDLNHSAFKSIQINLPELAIQKKVGPILNTISDKIELNQQTNQTLEQMAQALFKSWFVDFDPVFDNMLAKADFKLENLDSTLLPEELVKKAKIRLLALNGSALADKTKASLKALAQGSPPLSSSILPQHATTHAHFPSEFEHNEQLGWIPKRWKDFAVNDMVKTVSETYPLKAVDKVVFLNTGDISEGKFLHRNYSEPTGLPGQAKKSIKKGDILYSEIRPKNKRFALVNFDGSEHVVSTKLMVLRPNEGFEGLFPYFVLTQEKNISLLQRAAESRSGTFPQITYTELAMIRMALPQDKKLMMMFVETHLKDHFAQKDQRDFQNETLTKLRDTLLPKLISGQLQIPDLAKVVEK
jgi:type I restriction enzyme S subunit